MQFEINTAISRNAVGDFQYYIRVLKRQCDELTVIQRSLKNHEDNAMQKLAITVNHEIAALENEIRSLKVLQTGLEKICLYYEMNERSIEDSYDELQAYGFGLIKALSQTAVLLKGLSGIRSQFK